MAIYGISKTGVLTLLASRGCATRNRPIAQRNLDESITLYEAGASLATLAKQLDVPRETIRRGLIDAGITMRQRGRPAGASPKTN
jgi:lambda repressor-like predicted transcriptional regulator